MPVRDMTSDELIEHKETIQRLTERERLAQIRDEEEARAKGWIAGYSSWLNFDTERKFADLPEADKRAAFRLRGLGFVLLRENEDVTDLINEPHFVEWVRWAIADGPLKEWFEFRILETDRVNEG